MHSLLITVTVRLSLFSPSWLSPNWTMCGFGYTYQNSLINFDFCFQQKPGKICSSRESEGKEILVYVLATYGKLFVKNKIHLKTRNYLL